MADVIQKRYYYKVYDTNQRYLTTWSADVITDPTFRSVINGGAGELVVQLARSYDNFGEGDDVALKNRVELWVADGDNLVNNANDATLWDQAIWDTDLWDMSVKSFVKLYTGYISAYAPLLDDEHQFVEITLLGYVTETAQRILVDGSGNTQITYTNKDPGFIFQDIIDKYRASGGTNLNYVGSSIALTGTSVTYTFNANTLKECFDKLVELAPNDWFWTVDASGAVYFKQATTTAADHTVTIGKDIAYLQTTKRLEILVNQVYVIGGGNPNLYNVYSRQSSINTYGKFESKIQDGRVTDNATADLLAKNMLDHDNTPETRSVLRIIDNNGENSARGANIEAFKVGDTVQIKNLQFGQKGETLWDQAFWDTDVWDATLAYTTAAIMVIQSITYYPDYIEIEASSRLPEVAKELQTITTILDTQTQQNLPSAPAIRTV